tara:strand:- start:251 stop:1402 length:1152 start_codon:yes stop_codon:yes gene_type:complete
MKKKLFTAIGLMSGTSMDGVDLSLLKSDGYSEFTHILDKYFEFDHELQNNLINLRNKLFTYTDLDKYSREIREIDKKFTLFNAKIINQILKDYDDEIDIVGFHGQTIFHDVENKISKQLGDGKLLSQIIQKIVVNNFRQKDLINGGQGAPLIPIFHKLLSKFLVKEKHNLDFPLNIINIGGITNITQIISNKSSLGQDLNAYDIGPGNCLIDEWVRKNSDKKFDEGGSIAKSGNVNRLVLNQALDNFSFDTYFKSLDLKDFDISFVKGLSLEDGCATLTKFSAELIAKGIMNINNLNNSLPKINLICGGGRKNNFLIDSIVENLDQKKTEFKKIDDFGFDGDFIESQGFGYLSIRSYLNLPISFPNTTRCKSPTVGGLINKNF